MYSAGSGRAERSVAVARRPSRPSPRYARTRGLLRRSFVSPELVVVSARISRRTAKVRSFITTGRRRRRLRYSAPALLLPPTHRFRDGGLARINWSRPPRSRPSDKRFFFKLFRSKSGEGNICLDSLQTNRKHPTPNRKNRSFKLKPPPGHDNAFTNRVLSAVYY